LALLPGPPDLGAQRQGGSDLVEVYNDNGLTQAVVYPTPTAKRK
jgi:arsenite oxidase large subunit